MASPGINVPAKLFVSRLPPGISEAELKETFDTFGPILEVVVLRKKAGPGEKGLCGFVRFADVDYCDAAIRTLHGQQMLSGAFSPMKVQFAQGEIERLGIDVNYSHLPDPDDPMHGMGGGEDWSASMGGESEVKLFVGALPRGYGDAQLQELFGQFGELSEVFIMRDAQGTSKGSAFVKYIQGDCAHTAIDELNGKVTLPEMTRPVEVRLAQPGSKGGGKGGAHRPPPPPSPRPPAPPMRMHHQAQASQYSQRPPLPQIRNQPPPPPGRPPPQHATYNAFGPSGGGAVKLFVGALPFGYGEQEVHDLFAQFGQVLEVHLMKKPDGSSKGSAFVKYGDVAVANFAIEQLHGKVHLPGMPRAIEVRAADAGGKGGGPQNGHGARYGPY